MMEKLRSLTKKSYTTRTKTFNRKHMGYLVAHKIQLFYFSFSFEKQQILEQFSFIDRFIKVIRNGQLLLTHVKKK